MPKLYAHTAAPPGFYYAISAGDRGDLAPGTNNGEGTFTTSNLAYNAGAGSLAMSTAAVQITYITAQGESLPSGGRRQIHLGGHRRGYHYPAYRAPGECHRLACVFGQRIDQ